MTSQTNTAFPPSSSAPVLGLRPWEGTAPNPSGAGGQRDTESRKDVNRPFQFNTTASENKMENSTKSVDILRGGHCDLFFLESRRKDIN